MGEEQGGEGGRRAAWIAWGQSVANGALGDRLGGRHPLGIAMGLYHGGRPLGLTAEALRAAHPRAARRVCVLVHGLGCTEDIWRFPDPARPERSTTYGALLEADLGYTPLYVRYNTGLAVAENGRALADLLAGLVACYPAPVEEIALIGHSMGGLVIRSACHAGAARGDAWAGLVRRAFYLGTPHDGAHLERLAHAAAAVLHAVPNPITRLIGDVFDLRSQGVKDLRNGSLLAPDVLDDGAGAAGRHRPRAVPWLAGAQHYLVGGTLVDSPEHVVSMLLGDGLVATSGAPPPWSTQPRPPIPPEHVRVFARYHHFRLAHDYAVYEQLRDWCAGE